MTSRADILDELSREHAADLDRNKAELAELKRRRASTAESFATMRQQIDAFERSILSDYETAIGLTGERIKRLGGEDIAGTR